MALFPPIPSRPADRAESWSEYQHRRALIALHRQQLDQIGAWLKADPAQWHWAVSYQFELTERLFPTLRQNRNQVLADFVASDRTELLFVERGILQDATIDFNFTPCRDR